MDAGPDDGRRARNHTATRLTNGRVVVAGGLDAAGDSLDSAELYDPATNTFSAAGTLTQAVAGALETLLPDGRVLLSGGQTGPSASPAVVATAQRYDPAANTWSPPGA